jgi:transcriptional regulator with XRE-family HTH domain
MHHPNYLAFHRRQHCLSDRELAALLGYASRSTISRCENGDRIPSLRFALACEVVFGVPARKLFPGLYERVEDTVLNNAAVLDREVRSRTGVQAQRIRRLLLQICGRVGNADQT